MKTLIVLCVLVAVSWASKCEEERDAANGDQVGAFVPNCDADGTYSDMQCHGSTGYCYCARTDGTQITEPARGKYESCRCHRRRDTAVNSNMVGNFVPTCQENGKYNRKQCWGSTGTCWCVNEETGEKLSITDC